MSEPTSAPSQPLLPWANIVAFTVVVTVNALSNGLPLNGLTAGEISDALPSSFTPAGYTFSIWGIIYLSLLGFIVYQALPANRNAPFLRQVGWFFVASCVANSAWIFAWHYGVYWLSILLMVALLVTLIAIYSRLDIGAPASGKSLAETVLVHLPFSLYLGWISVATIANIASVLPFYGWNGFGIAEAAWSAIMMLVAVVLVWILLWNRRNLPYAAVLIWALFGIRANFPDVGLIANTALLAVLLIAAAALLGYIRTRAAGKLPDPAPA